MSTTEAEAQTKRWRDLKKRAISAAVLGPGALLCIWLGALPWTALMAVAIAGLVWEWVHLCGLRNRALPGAAVPAAVFVACALAVFGMTVPALVLLALGFVATWAGAGWLRRRDGRPAPAGWLAFGVLYIGIAGISLIELRHDNEAGRDNVLFLIAVVWASDIGAYMFGRMLGGPKLAPSISPGKTWSGAIGGLVCTMVIGALVAGWTTPYPDDMGKAAVIAALLGVATQAGDLFESAFKRRFGVKDSSALIPGHGGLLDRLDGLLAAAPVAALLAFGVGYGVVLWR
ncbi:phosphatidate cytidylyltransferase [Roseomonas marmotae]|uniref:Phosphatidate cytidylyltransferase n=1 Tax=Roseomonas marmotae TaxID=2768161 RepID=A0ABS3K9X9_9PROT|nr:phosphatidate cytidylyltransferase [Roseomonas marmotae]MBO1074279.1 phosphatidate cytidylyltransferase [Roseomonas marmotae]QTI78033.1 phosphatidate cytidylyltransferase [Roseomonas marmotae]